MDKAFDTTKPFVVFLKNGTTFKAPALIPTKDGIEARDMDDNTKRI